MRTAIVNIAIERFLPKLLVAESGCWEWQAAQLSGGYGSFTLAGRTTVAHRFAYQYWVGPIPAGLTIDHRCCNPVCVNPDHLEAVTMKVNVLRSLTNPSAINARKTHCKRGHAFDEENTYRFRYGSGWGRACRACRHMRYQAQRQKGLIQ